MSYHPLVMVEGKDMIPVPVPDVFYRVADQKLPECPAEPRKQATDSSIWLQEGIRQRSLFDRQSGMVKGVPSEHFVMVRFTFPNGKTKRLKVALSPADMEYQRQSNFLYKGKIVHNCFWALNEEGWSTPGVVTKKAPFLVYDSWQEWAPDDVIFDNDLRGIELELLLRHFGMASEHELFHWIAKCIEQKNDQNKNKVHPAFEDRRSGLPSSSTKRGGKHPLKAKITAGVTSLA